MDKELEVEVARAKRTLAEMSLHNPLIRKVLEFQFRHKLTDEHTYLLLVLELAESNDRLFQQAVMLDPSFIPVPG